ncbi:hypothetical protein SUDANB58_04870 [Streptomyces sp. enrichment culture]|uniref:hypothetical protein n=1 Tax=Streptomyces sp. enrichment culture TaxID=1795815 RepID=UPI003F570DDD
MRIHTAPNFDTPEPAFNYADITSTSAYDKTDEGLTEGTYDAADRDLTVFARVGAQRTATKGRS